VRSFWFHFVICWLALGLIVLAVLSFFLLTGLGFSVSAPKWMAHSPRGILLSFTLLLFAAISFLALLAAITWRFWARSSQGAAE
jgi:hypothetical protein